MTASFKGRVPWREKLEGPAEPRIVEVPDRMARRLGHGSMLIPRPLDVDALIRPVKRGKLVRVAEIRTRLALDHRLDVTCPLTTGIFIRIAGEVAEEDRRAGKRRITPYRRVVRDDGSLNEKFPGGSSEQARRLREEVHQIERVRRSMRVKHFEKRLMKL
jgi:hypothetical protein